MEVDDVGRMISVGQAARMMGVTPKTLRIWCAKGLVPYIATPRRQKRFYEGEIRSLLESLYVAAR